MMAVFDLTRACHQVLSDFGSQLESGVLERSCLRFYPIETLIAGGSACPSLGMRCFARYRDLLVCLRSGAPGVVPAG